MPAAPKGGLRVEGTVQDEHHGIGDAVEMHDQHGARGDDVEDRHEGDDLFGHAGDGTQTAQCHQRHGGGEYDGGGKRRNAKRQRGGVLDGVDLCEGADAEEGDEYAAQREGACQHTAAETPFKVVHGAARHLAVGVGDAILHGQKAFCVFGGHAEERGHPHPEKGTGAASRHGGGHADDVACADGGRQCGAQRGERRHVTFLVVFVVTTEDVAQGKRKPDDLKQAEADGKVDARTHQQGE